MNAGRFENRILTARTCTGRQPPLRLYLLEPLPSATWCNQTARHIYAPAHSINHILWLYFLSLTAPLHNNLVPVHAIQYSQIHRQYLWPYGLYCIWPICRFFRQPFFANMDGHATDRAELVLLEFATHHVRCEAVGRV